MAKKKVFVCFDYDNDKHYKYLLNAWDSNPDFDFFFSDMTPGEIQTNDFSRIKAGLTTKINQATYTLVLVGKYTNTQHKDYKSIGYKNWQIFEIEKSKENKNKIVAIKLESSNDSPSELYGIGASWAYSFNKDSIVKALNEA